MPLATPGQYARTLDTAAERRYAYAAVNVTSSETLNAGPSPRRRLLAGALPEVFSALS